MRHFVSNFKQHANSVSVRALCILKLVLTTISFSYPAVLKIANPETEINEAASQALFLSVLFFSCVFCAAVFLKKCGNEAIRFIASIPQILIAVSASAIALVVLLRGESFAFITMYATLQCFLCVALFAQNLEDS